MPYKDPEARKRCKSLSRGMVGSLEREAYNEKRRFRRKQSVLLVLAAQRKHRRGLVEFITRKAA